MAGDIEQAVLMTADKKTSLAEGVTTELVGTNANERHEIDRKKGIVHPVQERRNQWGR